jgi:Bacterial virulence factor lipase N-terminal
LKNLLLAMMAGGAALTGAACAPDVPEDPGPPPSIVVAFDPSVMPSVAPTPNDLTPRDPAGKLQIPSALTDTPAQTEFNAEYLGSLTAFPFESTAQALVTGALDPSTVSGQSVVVIDMTELHALPASPGVTAIVGNLQPTFDPVANALVVGPPSGGWTRAHQYGVVLVTPSAAHPAGLRGASGERVIGSPAWALVSSPSPLVVCPNGDLTSPQCVLAVDVIPSAQTDPTQRLADQTAKALFLEQVRLGTQPLLEKAEQLLGLSDATSIPMAWSFTIIDAGEMTFDPATGIIPFPNDLLRPNGMVSLPSPITGQPLSPSDCASPSDPNTALTCGLNTLDGFSTLAAPVSENGLTTGAAQQATLSAASLTPTSVGLLPLASTAPVSTTPLYAPCFNCLSSTTASGAQQTSPQQLQWQLVAPLDEDTTYVAYVTTDVLDDQGKNVAANPLFALLRLTHPLYLNGKSQVNVLTDLQAAALEPERALLSPAFDTLDKMNGIARQDVALAWTFTTQSESTSLDALHAYVSSQTFKAALPMLPPGIVVFADWTAQYTAAALASVPSIPIANIGKFYIGIYETPFALTGGGGTFDLEHPVAEPVTFGLAVPRGTMPAAGYPVTVFGHDLTRDRNDFLAIANALAAQGQATLATDAPFHGERSSCTGYGVYATAAYALAHPNAPVVLTDDSACADPATMMCNEDSLVGRCVARDQSNRMACPMPTQFADATGALGCTYVHMGACETDGKCEGGDFARDAGGRPLISGWNMFGLATLFATRDNFREQVIDLSQLVQVLRATVPTSLANRISSAGGMGAATLDLTKINYVGQGLGGILGTLFNAVSPDTTHVVTNTPGGDLPTLLLDAPSLAPQRASLLDDLSKQTPPVVPGTPAFDQFLATAQWVLDPADPANLVWRLTHPIAASGTVASPSANRETFIQFIEGDEAVPNISSLALVTAAVRPGSSAMISAFMPPSYGCAQPLSCYEFTEMVDGFTSASAPPANRHGFLLDPPSAQSAALTMTAQKQVATFVSGGTLQ